MLQYKAGHGEGCALVYKVGFFKQKSICFVHFYVPHSDRILHSLLVIAQRFTSRASSNLFPCTVAE